MKNALKTFAVCTCLSILSLPLFAEEKQGQLDWNNVLKTEYKLTDEQIKSMSDKGLKGDDMVRTARLAEKSNKSLDEVMKMRLDQHMGWGKVAKELGVPPSEIGHAIADAHHARVTERREERGERREDRKENRIERREERTERREDRANHRAERHEERAERRMDRAEDRAERREDRGHGKQ